MNIIKTLFNKKEDPMQTYQDFWKWFSKHEAKFYKLIKQQGDIENEFFKPLSSKIDEIKDGIWFLVGMADDDTAELIFTPDGIIKNIVFVEELVLAAPTLTNWKFTALKPATEIKNFSLEMKGYNFNEDKLSFYAIDYADYPDQIEIKMVHEDYNEDNATLITNGTFIFLDNYLGELDNISKIDYLSVTSKEEVNQPLIPISKLKDFLIWREKEFIEKYDGVRNDTSEDGYALMEGTLKNGKPLLATINTSILQWDSKPSHPWIATIKIEYDGEENNGMPNEATYQLLNEIEDKIIDELQPLSGYLYIGRETADGLREIYFACIEFREVSKVLYQIKTAYQDKIEIDYSIFKDKYWQIFNKYIVK